MRGEPQHRRLGALERPGVWFWVVLAAGCVLRLHMLLATDGTYDVRIWLEHAEGIRRLGLTEYTLNSSKIHPFNHPPGMGLAMSALLGLAEQLGIPFRIALRAPFAALDLATTFVLLRVLCESRWRFVAASLYWLCPLTIIFSAYHGNTDSALAFLALAAALLAGTRRPGWAGAVLAAGVAVKLPAVLAAPAIFFALSGNAARGRFVAAAAFVGLAGYLPGLVEDPAVMLRSVFLYGGQTIQTGAGIRVWGIQNFYPALLVLPEAAHGTIRSLLAAYDAANGPICIALIVLLAWARSGERSARGIAATIGMCHCVFYGFTNYWSFQYFAWSVPFLLCLDPRFSLPALGLMSAYIWGLYALLCGDVALLGEWDFLGHSRWPTWLVFLRDACVLLFFAAGCTFLARELLRKRVRKRPAIGDQDEA